MADSVSRILEHIPKAGNPPLHLWQPELSGDIDILIKADGSWWHEGGLIKRQSMVNMFASILRYEVDVGYVLVTPVEKWRIQVEDVAFICIAAHKRNNTYFFALNIGVEIELSADHPLNIKPYGDAKVPYIDVRDGLQARVNTAVYYQLANEVEEHEGRMGLWSGQRFYSME